MYKVIKDFKGSNDGFTILQFTSDELVDEEKLGADLLKVALAEKWVLAVKGKKPAATQDSESTQSQVTDEAEAALSAD